MAEIDRLMLKYGLSGLGVDYSTNQAWHPSVASKGYIILLPPEPGVFSGRTIDDAVAKVAAYTPICLASAINRN